MCPAGCDVKLYELTFELRSQRHLMENEANDENMSIENCRSNINAMNKSLKIVEVKLQKENDELSEFIVSFTFSFT